MLKSGVVLVVSVIYVWIFIADFLFAAMEFCFFFEFKDMNCAGAVSYTHLTLPTMSPV